MTIETQLDELIQIEGGYVNNAADGGGPTRFGITQAVARANGYAGDMRSLPIQLARDIYRRQYWTAPCFDRVAAIAPKVAAELFDTGVNMGVDTASRFMQRALNTLQGSGIAIDGSITPKGETLDALRVYMARRAAQDGELVLVELMNDYQGGRYSDIVEARASQRDFVFGWIRNRVMRRAA